MYITPGLLRCNSLSVRSPQPTPTFMGSTLLSLTLKLYFSLPTPQRIALKPSLLSRFAFVLFCFLHHTFYFWKLSIFLLYPRYIIMGLLILNSVLPTGNGWVVSFRVANGFFSKRWLMRLFAKFHLIFIIFFLNTSVSIYSILPLFVSLCISRYKLWHTF